MIILSENLSTTERTYLSSVIIDDETLDLEGMWALINAAWKECQCDPDIMDERISVFYEHPVWLLNGFFIEQHDESLSNRRDFTNYVDSLKPRRIADFGGGYGSLARMIGSRCSDAEVHIVELHPHAAAISLTEQTPNVRYVPKLTGEYDVLIATDVFEHVPDPLVLVESTAAHLRTGGEYLIANCFWPVIRCHLPSTFHFRWSWDAAMKAMNLQPGKPVTYGRAYKRVGPISAIAARGIEQRSKRWFELIEWMPGRVRALLARFVFSGLQ
ncbi:MAG: class I SAM-dependent methyltransferase [Proteobacteria bacterium]|nr:class I SAM-dependent methyltransferase [Pseudomonadota bacterium]